MPLRRARTGEAPIRVTVLASPAHPSYHLAAVVVLSSPGDTYRLTGRELKIFGLLIEGWSNSRIAAALDISEYATAAHLEYILVRLDASTRTLAMLRAARRGLYVPRALPTQHCSGPATTDHASPLPRALEQPLPAPPPTSVKRAVGAIEAHADYPFTTRRLVQIANVSVRTLQGASANTWAFPDELSATDPLSPRPRQSASDRRRPHHRRPDRPPVELHQPRPFRRRLPGKYRNNPSDTLHNRGSAIFPAADKDLHA